MSVLIYLRPETERRLAARAAPAGLSLEQYLQQIVEREGANGSERPPTFEEMTSPLAEAVEAAGVSEDELGEFLHGVVKEVRAEKRPVSPRSGRRIVAPGGAYSRNPGSVAQPGDNGQRRVPGLNPRSG